jgi:virginiamycin B lyase
MQALTDKRIFYMLVLLAAVLMVTSVGEGTVASQGGSTQTVDIWPLPTPDVLPGGIDVDPNTGEVYFTTFNYGLGRLDPATNGLTEWQIDGGPNQLELCLCSGNTLYAVFTQSLADRIGLLLTGPGWYRSAAGTTPGGFAKGLDVVPTGGAAEAWFTERLGGHVGRMLLQPSDFDPQRFMSTPDRGQVISPQAIQASVTTTPVMAQIAPGNPALPPAAVGVSGTTVVAMTTWDLSSVYAGDVVLEDVAVDPNGQVWIANSAQPILAQLDPQSGTALLHDLPSGSAATSLTVGGNLIWFTEGFQNKIGALDPATGDVFEWSLPAPGQPAALRMDDHFRIWFADREGNRIGLLDWVNDELTLYQLPPDTHPIDLALDANGDVWFVTERGNYIGRIVTAVLGPPPGPISDADIDVVPAAINFGSVPIGTGSANQLVIRNVGGSPLTVSQVIASPSPPFGVDPGPGGMPFVLQAGESHSLAVRFQPTVSGPATGALQISSDDPDEGLTTVLLFGTGIAAGPGTGEILLQADRGCGLGARSYNFGDPITLTFRVSEAGTGVLYDFAPEGQLKPVALGLLSAGVERTLTAQIAAAQGIETFVLQVTTVTGRTLAVGCSVPIGGTNLASVQITTNKGCEAVFSIGEPLAMSYAVTLPVSRVRLFVVSPGRGAVQLTPIPLTSQTGTISGTVGPPSGDRVLVVVAVTPAAGILSAHCRYRVP